MSELKVLGVTSGIGSLQYGFRKWGFEVLDSHEWRKYYNPVTFNKNYGVNINPDYIPNTRFKGVDCIVGHPECGNFSNLYTGPNRLKRTKDPGDIHKFIDLVKDYQPKTFLADNLPPSLEAVTKQEWSDAFPDYKIYYEFISNWGYGNIQKFRNRLFIIGVHKDLDWKFVPKETKHDTTISDVISDIKPGTPNHFIMQLSDITQWSGYQIGKPDIDRKVTLGELQEWFEKHGKNSNLPYFNKQGELKGKPGYWVIDVERFSPVLTGGGGLYDNHWIKDGYFRPLSIRERLRIQGFDDDFIVYPLEFEWGSKDHISCIKQTGKCMPTQFPAEFARQLAQFLNDGIQEEGPALRLLKQF
jgi:site-specific DNA-cytosine methylase